MIKKISELSLEEMMEIAKNPIKEDEFKKLPPARRFILSDGLEAGDYKMPAILIYDRYVKWCEAYKVKPANKVDFFKELAKYFTKGKTNEGFHYLVSVKGFDISPAYLVMAKEKHNIKGKRNSSSVKTKKERKNGISGQE